MKTLIAAMSFPRSLRMQAWLLRELLAIQMSSSRQELLQAREKHKEEQVIALKQSMQSGMAQAMKEQAQLREEMAYQYKLGNFEAAAAIQRSFMVIMPS
ncbi:uncharacterized protein LOC107630735 isoform X2 [Arachis ipaensis]|uniref:uncharacterized protein LOC107630735 isoform X2 n=1 Tax=Arachis ipaensis TaxID=130454 RepID=UPI000A2B7D8F|nr:uncharacterized protein LOC107630735 isoform X2 [Arachis ipaensis]XP_020974779.1 uncharacterized protein LOC107630735 isoform X2 [Arachis ipaensis]XP_020974780.1 uncharacterized protein LOC107630735 isoform X2 [Arachis ipaensis]